MDELQNLKSRMEQERPVPWEDLPDLASASQEDIQLTMEMESALRRLREAEDGEGSVPEPEPEPNGGEGA